MNEMTKAPASKSQSPLSIFDRPLCEPLGWLRTEIDRLFDDFGRPTRSVFNFGQRGLAPVPALDMVDDEKAYRLTAELPGLRSEERRVGKECVRPCRSWWSPDHITKPNTAYTSE